MLRKSRKFLAGLLSCTMAISVLPNLFVSAQEATIETALMVETSANVLGQNPSVFKGENFEVSFNVTSKWDTAFNADITIKNISDKNIENWAIKFDMPYEIASIWNSVIGSNESGTYTIKNAGYNQDINAGQSVSFGFTANTTDENVVYPSSYQLLGTQTQATTESYDINFKVASYWQSGFNGEIAIKNISDKPIEDWQLEFDFDHNITSFWEAEILSHEGNHYVIKNRGYNANIQAGQTLTLGFGGNPGNVQSQPENYVLTYVGMEAEEIDYETDTDGDGIPDYFETQLGTDINKVDTDGDGLSDYTEIVLLATDPLKIDTDDNGVLDPDEDLDSDGLTNLKEIELSTDPQNNDSDFDSLSDGEEVNTYGTDPLEEDTDGDTILDGDEIVIGLDPLNPATKGVPDNEYTFEQTVSAESEDLSRINTDENPFKLSIDIDAAGKVEGNLKASESGYAYVMQNDATLGIIPELKYNENMKVESVKVSFKIDDEFIDNTGSQYAENNLEFSGIKRYNIFKYFEDDNMLLPIETKFDIENNIIYTQVDELGTYCIMDMEKWLKGLGIEPENQLEPTIVKSSKYLNPAQASQKQEVVTTMPVNYEEPITTAVTTMPVNYEEPITTSVYENDSVMQENTMIQSDAFKMQKRKSPDKPAKFNGHEYAIYDQSMSWIEAKRYCEELGGHLVTINSQNEQDFINNIITEGSKNLYWIGATCTSGSWQWITDETFDYTNWDIGEPNSINEKYIHIYRNTWLNSKLGSWNNTNNYNSGSAFHATSNIGIICEWEWDVNYNVITATGLNKIALDRPLSEFSLTDTDGDTIRDWDEVDTKSELIKWDASGKIILPTFQDCINYKSHLTYVKDGLSRLNNSSTYIYYVLNNTRILPIISDPTSKDGDGDEIKDKDDLRPLVYDYTDLLIYQFIRKPGINEDGSIADDMTYCDYNEQELRKIGGLIPTMVDNANLGNSNWLETQWKLFFKSKIENNEMEDVSIEMIDHFLDGSGTDFRNQDLTDFVYNHPSTQRYINGAKNTIIEELISCNGNLGSLKYTGQNIKDPANKFVFTLYDVVGKPHYDNNPKNPFKGNFLEDTHNGLTLMINDTWGNYIEIEDYKFDGNNFSGKIKFTIYDHFGLDPEDIEKSKKFLKVFNYDFKDQDGFAAWFTLQHYEIFELGYRPFITYLEYEESFSGSIN